AATSILEFGMNPGLVSAFVKAAIDEIIENDSSVFVSEHRDCLMSLAEECRYAEAASLLKITKIVETDNDDQETLIPYEENVFYSTWNAQSFHCECTSHSQIAFGTEEALNNYSNLVVRDTEERWGMLEGAAADCRESVFSPQGTAEGFVTAHEELYTIREYLRFGEYAPTVYFVYSPCTYAKRSLAAAGSTIPEKIHLIAKNEIISGGESVGVILYGDNFQPRYFGSYLLTADSAETATAVQVSASLFAAYQYIVNHPHKGLLFPEDLDHREVLRYASMHLGSYISEVL
ncbi:MAG: hypothetical protein IKS32_09085, partial [Solobacterium sp.]|nr:hypothetical protein [Solobacterium sp.]